MVNVLSGRVERLSQVCVYISSPSVRQNTYITLTLFMNEFVFVGCGARGGVEGGGGRKRKEHPAVYMEMKSNYGNNKVHEKNTL